ncbi:MAG: TraR/DksA family transcriptional regulator [Gammaproteobacteria bacterium]|nr:TraR/DksA family transcriptional regulator [Gammaproteobacteria bacterium]
MNLDQIREKLLARKAEIEARLQRTHKHIYLKDEPVSANFNEQIKQTENDELVMTLEAEGREEINQIDHALQRLCVGFYLCCTTCGYAFGEKRLQVIPYAEQCIACASMTGPDRS